MPINPAGMSLIDWADSTILTVDDAWGFSRLDDPERWRDWAVQFVRAQPFVERAVPHPDQFEDWREWAERAYPYLEGARTG